MYKFEILTEDVNRDRIIAEVSKFFDGFSVVPMIGFWERKQEKSLNIMIIAMYDERANVRRLANSIQSINDQESVMVLASQIDILE